MFNVFITKYLIKDHRNVKILNNIIILIYFINLYFSWPCLHQWLETRSSRQVCPVCKAVISKDKVIPIYGRGNTKQEDPRYEVPHFILLRIYD